MCVPVVPVVPVVRELEICWHGCCPSTPLMAAAQFLCHSSSCSMAAPFVAAAAAVVKSASGGVLTPALLRTLLTGSAQGVPAQAGQVASGLLRLDTAMMGLSAQLSQVPRPSPSPSPSPMPHLKASIKVRPSPSPKKRSVWKIVTVWVACKKAGEDGECVRGWVGGGWVGWGWGGVCVYVCVFVCVCVFIRGFSGLLFLGEAALGRVC